MGARKEGMLRRGQFYHREKMKTSWWSPSNGKGMARGRQNESVAIRGMDKKEREYPFVNMLGRRGEKRLRETLMEKRKHAERTETCSRRRDAPAA